MAKDAQVSGARTFGMSAFDVDHVTLDGQVWNTMHEAFNVIGARNFSITGQAEWDGDTSIDYGCSVDGTAGIACRNGFVNVRVKQSFKTGIILTGDVLDTVVIPRVQDCNLSGDNDEGGVVLSGSNCQRNVVLPGFVYDSTGGTLHKYGIAELNLGNGEPSNNALYVGEINGFAIGAVRRAGPTTKIIGGTSISQSAAVSPTSGAYGSATATLQWSFDRELVVVDNLLVSIPAVGTGAGPIVVALPVSCNPQSGVLHGYDDATGKAVTGSVGTNVVRIRYADGTTGFVNGTSINLSGRYKPTA